MEKEKIRGICKKCGERPRQSKGKGEWFTLCWKCRQPTLTANSKYRKNAIAKSKIKKEDWKCSLCGFIPQHPAQMDLDHIDGNRHNNESTNHQLICANCHRLKTVLNGDHLKVYNYQEVI